MKSHHFGYLYLISPTLLSKQHPKVPLIHKPQAANQQQLSSRQLQLRCELFTAWEQREESLVISPSACSSHAKGSTPIVAHMSWNWTRNSGFLRISCLCLLANSSKLVLNMSSCLDIWKRIAEKCFCLNAYLMRFLQKHGPQQALSEQSPRETLRSLTCCLPSAGGPTGLKGRKQDKIARWDQNSPQGYF